MWIYQSGSDGKHPVALYEYQPGRASVYPIEFLKGFHGMIQCDGYAAYGCIEDVILICCLAHARRKFFDAVPKGRQKESGFWISTRSRHWMNPFLQRKMKICFLLKKESPSAIVCSSRNVCIRSYLRKTEKQNVLKKKHQSGMNSGPGLTRWIHLEEAKANNMNAYKYLYTLLLYMPDYKNEPAGIEQLLPWSTFVQDKCSGIIDDSLELPENRGNLSI